MRQPTRPQDHKTNLICVLDWGLGHATRSLALAERLEAEGQTIHWASSGYAREVLRKALPEETIVHQLPAYNVRYPTGNMPFNVALQLPKWSCIIRKEHQRTKSLVAKLGVDRIISDNRFGCYHHAVPSVLLTHQLHPITGSAPVSWGYRKWLRYCFTEFWVPDFADQRLSGKLSDERGYPNVHYIGPLSRLKPANEPVQAYDYFALLSGPEPMRSRLEAELTGLLRNHPGQHLLVRGVPSSAPSETTGNLTVQDYAGADFLSAHLPAARSIICRSGYSTLMDLAVLSVKGKVILVPTPGQTEQEFLARSQVQSGSAEAMRRQGKVVL